MSCLTLPCALLRIHRVRLRTPSAPEDLRCKKGIKAPGCASWQCQDVRLGCHSQQRRPLCRPRSPHCSRVATVHLRIRFSLCFITVRLRRRGCSMLWHVSGYELTDFQLVQAPWPSTRPSVVNLVQLDITLARQLQPGEAAHMTIVAPTSSKAACQFLKLHLVGKFIRVTKEYLQKNPISYTY
ncbi:unnamed protein product [Cladocopium goreaui]|uniref:E3 ubiquitin-protein ligase HERC2 n=1 Tax=Cladocopium goreaui TaxID=2562237 RepID=A0A9P1BR39_9DINO|nr:unnamed protein product [Cladocopium goreaui]